VSLAYYRFLARRVPPGILLASAARRAARRAGNRVLPPDIPDALAVGRALGCRSDADWVALFPRAAAVPWTPAALRRTLDRHLPGELPRALLRARAAAAGRVHVYGRLLDVREPRRAGGQGDAAWDWQRDPLHGGRFDGGASSVALPTAPGQDPRMAWALARGEPWVALACGAALDAGDGAALATALSASVGDFLAQNPVGRGVHWASAMEAGLRAWNLLVALRVLAVRALPEPSLARAAAVLFAATGRFVLAHLEDDTAVPNNHLTSDLVGLLACAEALPGWPEAPRWRALAVAGLRRAAAEQVLADGLSFEGSVPYHRFALELFAAGLLLARGGPGPGSPGRLAERDLLGATYARTVRRMYGATRALLPDSGALPQLGDNDSGHALALRQRGPTEGGYLLPLGAALFRDAALLRAPGAGDAAEALWLFGPAAVRFLARASPGPPPGSAVFPAGGFHALRRGPVEAFVSCGASGQRGIGGHSHNDKLGLELWVAGAQAVCDPGMPVYGRDPAQRDRFRATAAHATVEVDGLEQVPLVPGRLFALPDEAGARVEAFARGATADHLVGAHRGYQGRARVTHRRALWATAEGLLVVDRLEGRGVHTISLRWPLAAAPGGATLRPLSPGERDAVLAFEDHAALPCPVDLARAVAPPARRRRPAGARLRRGGARPAARPGAPLPRLRRGAGGDGGGGRGDPGAPGRAGDGAGALPGQPGVTGRDRAARGRGGPRARHPLPCY
jgi:hypothetical protein